MLIKCPLFPKTGGQKQIHGSVVLAQRETESLCSAVCLDCIPRCLFAMSAAASSTDWVPPPPPGPPPAHIKGLALKQIPRPVAPQEDLPDWTNDDDIPPLEQFKSETFKLKLPPGIHVSDMKWLSVYCRKYTVDFGNISFE